MTYLAVGMACVVPCQGLREEAVRGKGRLVTKKEGPHSQVSTLMHDQRVTSAVDPTEIQLHDRA